LILKKIDGRYWGLRLTPSNPQPDSMTILSWDLKEFIAFNHQTRPKISLKLKKSEALSIAEAF